MKNIGIPDSVVESISDQVRRTVHQLSEGASSSQIEDAFGPVGFISVTTVFEGISSHVGVELGNLLPLVQLLASPGISFFRPQKSATVFALAAGYHTVSERDNSQFEDQAWMRAAGMASAVCFAIPQPTPVSVYCTCTSEKRLYCALMLGYRDKPDAVKLSSVISFMNRQGKDVFITKREAYPNRTPEIQCMRVRGIRQALHKYSFCFYVFIFVGNYIPVQHNFENVFQHNTTLKKRCRRLRLCNAACSRISAAERLASALALTLPQKLDVVATTLKSVWWAKILTRTVPLTPRPAPAQEPAPEPAEPGPPASPVHAAAVAVAPPQPPPIGWIDLGRRPGPSGFEFCPAVATPQKRVPSRPAKGAAERSPRRPPAGPGTDPTERASSRQGSCSPELCSHASPALRKHSAECWSCPPPPWTFGPEGDPPGPQAGPERPTAASTSARPAPSCGTSMPAPGPPTAEVDPAEPLSAVTAALLENSGVTEEDLVRYLVERGWPARCKAECKSDGAASLPRTAASRPRTAASRPRTAADAAAVEDAAGFEEPPRPKAAAPRDPLWSGSHSAKWPMGALPLEESGRRASWASTESGADAPPCGGKPWGSGSGHGGVLDCGPRAASAESACGRSAVWGAPRGRLAGASHGLGLADTVRRHSWAPIKLENQGPWMPLHGTAGVSARHWSRPSPAPTVSVLVLFNVLAAGAAPVPGAVLAIALVLILVIVGLIGDLDVVGSAFRAAVILYERC
eukprot:jgi/Botrbrau1/16701/Bobra.0263s0001.1